MRLARQQDETRERQARERQALLEAMERRQTVPQEDADRAAEAALRAPGAWRLAARRVYADANAALKPLVEDARRCGVPYRTICRLTGLSPCVINAWARETARKEQEVTADAGC